MHFECHFFLICKTIFLKMAKSAKGAIFGESPKKSTTLMEDPLGMISYQYENNLPKTVGGDTF